MTTCSQAGCPNTDLKLYKLPLRRQYTLICESCVASLSAIGLVLTAVERRSTDVPVLHERRRFHPRWLERLTGRVDDSWRAVA